MDDAEALEEALDGFRGDHGRTVVGEKSTRQCAFLKRPATGHAREASAVFVEIPLEMATEARAIVENAGATEGVCHCPDGVSTGREPW